MGTSPELVGAGNCVTLCGLRILVDQAAEPVSAHRRAGSVDHGQRGADELPFDDASADTITC